jgi:hypothetical protein
MASATATWPLVARAAQMPVIGFLSGRSFDDSRKVFEAF